MGDFLSDEVPAGGLKETAGKGVRNNNPRVNRYVLVVILCFYCLLAGPAYFNWTPIADILLQHGVFKWKCTPEEIAAATGSPNFVSYEPLCKAQELAINSLFMIASSSNFCCSFLGGLLLDLAGPKATGMIGIGALLVGWLLLALSTETVNCFIVAAVLIGMSTDTAFFPCLSAANLFPSKGSTVIAFFGCFRSLSFTVPLTMRAAVIQRGIATAPQAMLVYCGVFLVLCFFVAVLLLPRKAHEKATDNEETGPYSSKQPSLTETPTGTQCCDAATTAAAATAATTTAAAQRRARLRDWATVKLRSFGKECCSLSYLPLLPLFSFLMTNIVFFIPSTLHLIPEAYEANQVIQTFSFLPCPFFGLLADQIGILPVMHLLNLCGLLCYVCVVIPGIPAYRPLQFIAPILFAVQISFLMSQLYCYVSVTFSQQHLGTLVGLVCAVGGLFSLITGPMRSFALDKGFMPMCVLAISFALSNAVIISYLHILQIRRTKRKRLQITGQATPQDDRHSLSPPPDAVP